MSERSPDGFVEEEVDEIIADLPDFIPCSWCKIDVTSNLMHNAHAWMLNNHPHPYNGKTGRHISLLLCAECAEKLYEYMDPDDDYERRLSWSCIEDYFERLHRY